MAAWECVHDLVGEPAWERAVDLIDALLAQASDDGEAMLVGAGPLEDLLSPRTQGAMFIAGVEQHARRDRMWAVAVAGIWLDRAADPEVNRRLAVFGARHADGEAPT